MYGSSDYDQGLVDKNELLCHKRLCDISLCIINAISPVKLSIFKSFNCFIYFCNHAVCFYVIKLYTQPALNLALCGCW